MIEERKYIVNTIFSLFFKTEPVIEISSDSDYTILHNNKKILIVEDHFFSQYSTPLDYLKKEKIPLNLTEYTGEFYEDSLPVIYGLPKIQKKEKTLKCSIDIFASCFFMLTRWEEHVLMQENNYDYRFPAEKSLAFNENFLHRPIVDEYAALLRNLLKFNIPELNNKSKEKEIFITHDVDWITFYRNFFHAVKVTGGDILKRFQFLKAFTRIPEYLLIALNIKKDRFDTFDYFLETAKKYDYKPIFYFMSGGTSKKKDNRYNINSKRAKNLLNKIKKSGSVIGIHGSYNAFNDLEQFLKEKRTLEKAADLPIIEARNHHLRFEVPNTWQVYSDAGIKTDSTLGYHNKEGFRCGTGMTYPVFNFLTRKELNIFERPLICMDCSLFTYQNYTYDEAEDVLRKMLVNSLEFTFLWHNSYIEHMSFFDRIINVQNYYKK